MQDVGNEGQGCVKGDLNILSLDSREYTNGCSPLYVGDIEIPIEDMVASTNSFEHKYLAAE